jgi:DNA-binding MarR family transcriptional regulator
MSSLLTYDERVVLTSILTEGRVNLSKLARMLGRTRQVVFYWVRRMLEMGILGPPQVYVRPDVVGLYYAYFRGRNPGDDYVLAFRTLEGDYIFAVPFKTPTELQDLSLRYGTPMFVPNLKPLRLTPLKLRALRMYVSNPQISSSDLVEELGVGQTAARRLLKWAKDVSIVTYSVDLPRSGLFAAALMAKAHIPGVTKHTFFRCYAKAVGFYGVVFPDVEKASQYIEEVKKTDPSVSATPLVSYQLRPPPIEERPY